MTKPPAPLPIALAKPVHQSNPGPMRPLLERVSLVFLALLLLAPYAVYPYFLMEALCFAMFAGAFNLLLGFAGMLSFGHAMFFGLSSYISAHCARALGLAPEACLLLGTLGAALLGALTGALAIRREGLYFAMITLAMAQLVYFVFLEAPFTHGEDGIQGVPHGKLFGTLALSDPFTLYYVVLGAFCLHFLLIARIIHSPYGAILKAIRENERRALSLGYDVAHYKLLAFVLSAALAGFAGALKAIVMQNATLTDAYWTMSGEVVLMTLLGGLGTHLGPGVGAFVITGMQHYLASFGQWVLVIQGVIFVACVMALRQGIIGTFSTRLGNRL